MFDTSTLTPIERGRVDKYLNGLCRYDGQIMTKREAYERLQPVTKDRYRIHRDPNKPKAYGLSTATGTSLDCPALVWKCCTLPVGRE